MDASLARLAGAALVAALVAGAIGFVAGGRRAPAGDGSAQAADLPARAADESPVVLRVADETVTVDEFEERWRQEGAARQSFHGSRAKEIGLASGREHFLDELADELLLAREARRRGFDERADVRAASRACANRIVSRPLLAREVREAALPQSEIEAWYAANADRLGEPASVQISEIIVTSSSSVPGDTTPDAPSARARIDALRQRVAGGEDFAALATAASEAPSARYGGYVGWITAGRFARAWEERALALRKGETSEVFEIPEGFAVLHARDRRETTIPPLEEVRDRVMDELLADDQGALQRRYEVFVGTLQKAEPVETHPEHLRRDAPPPPAGATGTVSGPSQG